MVNLSFEYINYFGHFIMRWWWGDHLNSAIHQGDQKNFTHTVGGSLKIFKAPPPPGKNDTFLSRNLCQACSELERISHSKSDQYNVSSEQCYAIRI